MNEDLKYTFDKVNDWLKFAEAKNAMLIGFNGVVMFGVFRIFKDELMGDFDFFKGYLIVAFIPMVFSFLLAVASFFPKTSKVAEESQVAPNADFVFFGHLKDMGVDNIIKEYCRDNTVKPLDRNLASQIIQNSKIADKKFYLFKIACMCAFWSFAMLVFGSLFYFMISST